MSRICYSKNPEIDRALSHSVKDGVAYSIMSGGSETYFSAYALFLKATAPQIAVIASLPQLLGASAQMLSAWLGHVLGRRRPVMLVGAALQAFSFIPLMLAMVYGRDNLTLWLVGAITLYFLGANIAAPQWTSLMGDLVPERKRGRFFGRRTRLTTFATFCALATAGVILDIFDRHDWTLWGFIGLFSVAILARLSSLYHLAAMGEPVTHNKAGLPGLLHRDSLQALRSSGVFHFSSYFVLMQFAVGISAPFFSVYMLRELEFSYIQFMANTGMAVLVQFLTLNNWGRIGDAFGNRLVLVVTGSIIPFLPALWLISPSFWWLLALQVLAGLAWGGFSLSATNLMYDFVPARHRASYSALHSFVTAAAAFAGAMLGAVLVARLPPLGTLFSSTTGLMTPILGVFLTSAVLRLIVAILMLNRVREVRPPRRSLSARNFVYRATRFNAFSGLVYEFVTLFRKNDRQDNENEHGDG